MAVALAGALALAGCGSRAASPPAGPAASASARSPVGPTAGDRPAADFRFYLSLGDSLAFGYQKATLTALRADGRYRAAAFHTGYTDVLTAALRRADPGLVSENLGCPGESAASFAPGGCPFPAQLPGVRQSLHVPYAGSQQAAAVAFLKAQHGRPGLVTVSLGANDIGALLTACHGVVLRCLLDRLPAALRAVRTELSRSLTVLQAADPAATDVVLAPYNPYAVITTLSDPLVVELGDAITAAARLGHARVANAFTSFNASPGEQARLCRLTAICTPQRDIHPTDAGYRLLASIVLATLG